MTPAYRIAVNGKNITDTVSPLLVSLSINDEAGLKSDQVTLTLDDRDQQIEAPNTGAKMKVAIGYLETGLIEQGEYTVDEVTAEGPPDALIIRAKAADMGGDMKAPREKSWHLTTLGGIIKAVAETHKLTPVIPEELASIAVPHADQTESDYQFLTRLAAENGATFKVANGRLVFAKRLSGKAASGQSLPAITIERQQVSSFSATISDRQRYKSVKAFWHDKLTAERIPVTIGEGFPQYSITDQTFPTADEATAAAKSKLDAMTSTADAVSLQMPGRADVFAEQPVKISGFKRKIDGDYVAVSVRHNMSRSGFTTAVELERKTA